ncbi:MAG: sensor histidine kinase [Opitutales bacterium]|nr:sensor histidine kinase [Opitutales bacterium]
MAFAERFRWAWLVCILLLAGFVVNSVSSYLVSRGNIRQTITNSSLPLTSDNVYSEIQRDLLRPVFISSLMANDTFLRDWVIEGEKDDKQIVKYLHEIKQKYGTVTSFFVSDKTHRYYHSDGILKTVSEEEPRDIWYFRVKNMADAFEINVDPDLANQDAMTIFINYRVFDYYGNFIGATGVGLTVNSVNNLISDYESRYQRQIYFADEEGEIVLRPSNSPLMGYKNLNQIDGLNGVSTKRILGAQRNRFSYKRDGEVRFLNSRYVEELGWYLIVEQSEKAMLAPLRRQLLDNILMALVVTVIVAWICVGTINGYQKRLESRNAELSGLLQKNQMQQDELVSSARNLERANQDLSVLNREKDEIMSLVAHDLRNPLNGILGLCDIVESDPEAMSRGEFIDDVRVSSERMNVLIKNLLSASQMEANGITLELKSTNVDAILKDCTRAFQSEVQRKRIHFKTEIVATENCSIQTHEDWLIICINNILSNAIKYTPEYGEVIVRTEQNEKHLDIQFVDGGPGITREDRNLMFQKFQRLSAKPTSGESSTGLGLYLVKKMCDRLGMKILVDSKLGEGSVFTLRCPI